MKVSVRIFGLIAGGLVGCQALLVLDNASTSPAADAGVTSDAGDATNANEAGLASDAASAADVIDGSAPATSGLCGNFDAGGVDFARCFDFDDGVDPGIPSTTGNVVAGVAPDDGPSPPNALIFTVKPGTDYSQGLRDTPLPDQPVRSLEMAWSMRFEYTDDGSPSGESLGGIMHGNVYTYVGIDRTNGSVFVAQQEQVNNVTTNGRMHSLAAVDLRQWHRVVLQADLMVPSLTFSVDGVEVFKNEPGDFPRDNSVTGGTLRTGVNYTYGAINPVSYHFDDVTYRVQF